jgi:hypothetical protein
MLLYISYKNIPSPRRPLHLSTPENDYDFRRSPRPPTMPACDHVVAARNGVVAWVFHARRNPKLIRRVIELFTAAPREVKRVKPSRFAAAIALRHRLSCLRFLNLPASVCRRSRSCHGVPVKWRLTSLVYQSSLPYGGLTPQPGVVAPCARARSLSL